MKKKKINKEEDIFNSYVPICIMIGIFVGFVLSFIYNDFIITGYGALVGLLFGVILSSFKITYINKKKKKKKSR